MDGSIKHWLCRSPGAPVSETAPACQMAAERSACCIGAIRIEHYWKMLKLRLWARKIGKKHLHCHFKDSFVDSTIDSTTFLGWDGVTEDTWWALRLRLLHWWGEGRLGSGSKQFKAALFVYRSAVIACHCHVHCHCIALSWLTKLPGLHTICWAPRWATCKQAKLIKFPEWKCHYESMSTNVMAKTQIAAQTSKQTTLTWFADVFRCVSMCFCVDYLNLRHSPHIASVAYLLHICCICICLRACVSGGPVACLELGLRL